VSGNEVTIDIFVDQSSVEIIAGDGAMSMTNLVFPQTIYDRCEVSGADCDMQVRTLSQIW
jgi:fructan beta-fructosidase